MEEVIRIVSENLRKITELDQKSKKLLISALNNREFLRPLEENLLEMGRLSEVDENILREKIEELRRAENLADIRSGYARKLNVVLLPELKDGAWKSYVLKLLKDAKSYNELLTLLHRASLYRGVVHHLHEAVLGEERKKEELMEAFLRNHVPERYRGELRRLMKGLGERGLEYLPPFSDEEGNIYVVVPWFGEAHGATIVLNPRGGKAEVTAMVNEFHPYNLLKERVKKAWNYVRKDTVTGVERGFGRNFYRFKKENVDLREAVDLILRLHDEMSKLYRDMGGYISLIPNEIDEEDDLPW